MKRLFLSVAFIAWCALTPCAFAQNPLTPVPSRVLEAIDDANLIVLKGNVHPLAQRQFDRGAAPGSMPTGRISLVLRRSPAQQQALSQYLSDLQNPASPAYHKWLTPAQYGAAYGISESDFVQVETWLQTHGFKIEKAPAAHNVIEFSGSFDQVQSAFHTSIHSFVVNGETHFANVSDPQIPTALSPVIAGVGPLNDFHAKPTLVRGPEGRFDPSTGRILPDLTLKNGSAYYLFVDPADAAVIYDTPNRTLNPAYSGTTYDGTGVAIGIAGVSDLTSADVANYRMAFLGEVSGSVNLPTVVVDGNDPGLNGAGVEALVDTEIAGGIAPKAKIYFYTSADTDISSGLLNAIFRALDDNVVSILSMSFSGCEAALGASGNQIVLEAAEQAAAQGISVTVSAGDNGSAGCDDFDTESQATQGFAVNGFASTPFTIAVGGTDFDVLSTSFASYVNDTTSGAPPYYETALKYIPENPWNDSTSVNTTYSNNVASEGAGNIIAGSGGVSSVYSKPAFQSSLTPNDGFRDLPDFSLLAGNGMYNAAWVLCSDNVTDGVTSETYTDCLTTGGQFTSSTTFEGVGGTSTSAPAFAGMLALVAQAHGSAADNHRLGQADNILYQLAQSKYSAVFHDVTTGNNSVACASGSPDCGPNLFLTGYNAGAGYDLASGLGSVNAAAMVNNWTSVSLGSTSTTLQINGSSAAYSGVHGASLTLNTGVTSSSGTPTGVVAVTDNADMTAGGTASGPQNNGQIAIPLTSGSGSIAYNGLPGGSYQVTARYGGDTSHAASTSAPIPVSISAEPSTTTLTVNANNPSTGAVISTSNVPYGSDVFADATITGTAEGSNTQGVATGKVTFLNGSTTLGTATVSSVNQASWPPPSSPFAALTVGSYNLTAQYSGDASYSPSSGTASFTVVPAATSFSMDQSYYSLSSTVSGQSAGVTFELNTTWNSGMGPTGTVSLIESNQVIASTSNFILSKGSNGSTLLEYVTGTIFIQSSQFPAGLNTVTVAYSGDSNYAPSSTTITVDNTLAGGGLAITAPSQVTLSPGTTVTSTLTLTPSAGYTGSIAWSCYATTSTSSFTCSIPPTHVPLSSAVDTLVSIVAASSAAPGTYTADIYGSDNTSDGINLTGTFQIIVTSAASPSLAVMNNGPLNVSAGATAGDTSIITVIPSGGLAGLVNLSCSVSTSISNPQSLPTCSVPPSVTLNGTAPVTAQVQVNTTTQTTPGAYAVAVAASSASTSSVTTTDSVPLTVIASPSFTMTGSGVTAVFLGSSTTATATITPLNGYSGQVNLSCYLEPTFYPTGSGSLGTCSLPSSVTLSSGEPATVNVNIQNTALNNLGLYLATVSAFDPNSTDLGIDVSIDVAFTGQAAFTVGNGGSIQVNAGATNDNTTTISLTPTNGFTGAVNLSCKVSTSMTTYNDMPTCSIPASVTISGTSAATATLTVNTTAATSGAFVPGPGPFRFGGITAVLAALFLFGVRSKRRMWASIVGVLLLAVLSVWLGAIGCSGGSGAGVSGGGGNGGGGGGGGNPGTTAGSYSVTVTGTDAATGKITAQTTVSLNVD